MRRASGTKVASNADRLGRARGLLSAHLPWLGAAPLNRIGDLRWLVVSSDREAREVTITGVDVHRARRAAMRLRREFDDAMKREFGRGWYQRIDTLLEVLSHAVKWRLSIA